MILFVSLARVFVYEFVQKCYFCSWLLLLLIYVTGCTYEARGYCIEKWKNKLKYKGDLVLWLCPDIWISILHVTCGILNRMTKNYIYSFVSDCQVFFFFFYQGSYFGTVFLLTVRGQVSYHRGLRRAYKTFVKKSRRTPVLWQRPHIIIAMDVQDLLWCLHFYRSMWTTVWWHQT